MKALILALALAPLSGCATLDQVDWVAVSQSYADSAARSNYRAQALLYAPAPRSYTVRDLGMGRYSVSGY